MPKKNIKPKPEDVEPLMNDFPLTPENIELQTLTELMRNSQYRNIIKHILEQEKKGTPLIINVSLV